MEPQITRINWILVVGRQKVLPPKSLHAAKELTDCGTGSAILFVTRNQNLSGTTLFFSHPM